MAAIMFCQPKPRVWKLAARHFLTLTPRFTLVKPASLNWHKGLNFLSNAYMMSSQCSLVVCIHATYRSRGKGLALCKSEWSISSTDRHQGLTAQLRHMLVSQLYSFCKANLKHGNVVNTERIAISLSTNCDQVNPKIVRKTNPRKDVIVVQQTMRHGGEYD